MVRKTAWLSVLIVVFIVTAGLIYFVIKQPTRELLNKEKNMGNLSLTSSVFKNGEVLPSLYTCDGKDTNPPLEIFGILEEAKSLVLIMDDPDATGGETWDHWIVFNMWPTTKIIKQGEEPEGVHGKNSWGKTGYGGPCPPNGRHRYFFKLYALDTILDLEDGATKKKVEEAMNGHVLDKAELIGLYERMRSRG